MTASDNEWCNEWQRVVQQVTTNDNDWQRMATSNKNGNKWERMIASDKTNEYEWE